jgi:hypothetical protein
MVLRHESPERAMHRTLCVDDLFVRLTNQTPQKSDTKSAGYSLAEYIMHSDSWLMSRGLCFSPRVALWAWRVHNVIIGFGSGEHPTSATSRTTALHHNAYGVAVHRVFNL